MSVYCIFIRERLRDQNEIDEYEKLAPAAAKGHNMRPLAVYGRTETLEGAEAQGVVLLEFATYEEATAWYNSAEYAEAKKLRHLGADYRLIITQGL
jgi:uncharacterized protein (DUF1330 family)